MADVSAKLLRAVRREPRARRARRGARRRPWHAGRPRERARPLESAAPVGAARGRADRPAPLPGPPASTARRGRRRSTVRTIDSPEVEPVDLLDDRRLAAAQAPAPAGRHRRGRCVLWRLRGAAPDPRPERRRARRIEPVFDPGGPVLGIDPGLSRCGYGAVPAAARGTPRAVACGVIRTAAGRPAARAARRARRRARRARRRAAARRRSRSSGCCSRATPAPRCRSGRRAGSRSSPRRAPASRSRSTARTR